MRRFRALIESELFGYSGGAFTGARKEGAIGKIQQAHGGTLFLDEVSDMPLSLQARLLRVLQERCVTPLGTNKSIPADITLVCATHRRLKEEVARGGFREDLYYRLNGLCINLPSLRERSDIDRLIDKLLREEAGPDRKVEVSPVRAFLSYLRRATSVSSTMSSGLPSRCSTMTRTSSKLASARRCLRGKSARSHPLPVRPPR